MRTTTRLLLVAASALGLGASAVSTYVHYQLLTQPGFKSFCDVNATVSCTEAYLSSYGSFAGLPVAILGMLFFLVVLAIAALAGRRTPEVASRAPSYIFVMSTFGLAAVFYLAYASFFVLHVGCVLCITSYVATIAIFIVSATAPSAGVAALPGAAARDVRSLISSPSALAVVALLAIGVLWTGFAFPEASTAASAPPPSYTPATAQERATLAQWWKLQPKVDLPLDPGAKVTVIKFNDYQCPTCAHTYRMYAPIFAKYADKGVKLVVRHFPLETECNGSIKGGAHFASCEASAAVILARSHGTADKMEQWLFTNIGPPLLTPTQVREAARTVAGIPDFDAQYARALDEIRADAALGGRANIHQTPTFFINGRTVSQVLEPKYFEVLIELELGGSE